MVEIDPPPPGDPEAAVAWVGAHLDGLYGGTLRASPRFRGGQPAADAALAAAPLAGYAARRNEVWPPERRGATGLSPYIRHGLITLRRAWDAADDAPARDARKFRDELLWQEYARHLYARIGGRLGRPLRAAPAPGRGSRPEDAWDRGMACIDLTVGELGRDGWLVNQTRMWLASQWSVRHGLDPRAGERRFFRHLLDGSAAANQLGWQWVTGTATGRSYGFSRSQVRRRAPGLCATCPREHDCPIAGWPPSHTPARIAPPASLRADPDPDRTAGPASPEVAGTPRAVWLTAESLGDDDPALAAHPDLPVVFVMDAPMLRRLGLAAPRLVFLVESLAALGAHRTVRVRVGDPVAELAGTPLAVTHAPVPGFARRAARLDIAARHPWPWLTRPHGGSVASFSAWVRPARAGV